MVQLATGDLTLADSAISEDISHCHGEDVPLFQKGHMIGEKGLHLDGNKCGDIA